MCSVCVEREKAKQKHCKRNLNFLPLHYRCDELSFFLFRSVGSWPSLVIVTSRVMGTLWMPLDLERGHYCLNIHMHVMYLNRCDNTGYSLVLLDLWSGWRGSDAVLGFTRGQRTLYSVRYDKDVVVSPIVAAAIMLARKWGGRLEINCVGVSQFCWTKNAMCDIFIFKFIDGSFVFSFCISIHISCVGLPVSKS